MLSQIKWNKIPDVLNEQTVENAQVIALAEIAEQLNRLNDNLEEMQTSTDKVLSINIAGIVGIDDQP